MLYTYACFMWIWGTWPPSGFQLLNYWKNDLLSTCNVSVSDKSLFMYLMLIVSKWDKAATILILQMNTDETKSTT